MSPVSPAHPDSELDLLPSRLSKEELIQNMDRVDREITMVEQQISKLKKKQVGWPSTDGVVCLSEHPHVPVMAARLFRVSTAVRRGVALHSSTEGSNCSSYCT